MGWRRLWISKSDLRICRFVSTREPRVRIPLPPAEILLRTPTGLKPPRARNTPGSLGLCSQPPAMPDATRPVIPARPGARDNASAMASERSCCTRGRIANRRTPLRGDHCIKKPSGCRRPLAHPTGRQNRVCKFWTRRSHGRGQGWPLHGRRRNRLRRFLYRRTLRFIADRRVTYRLRLARLSSHWGTPY